MCKTIEYIHFLALTNRIKKILRQNQITLHSVQITSTIEYRKIITLNNSTILKKGKI